MPPSATFENLLERANQNLVAFLDTELDLGFTYLRRAELEAGMDQDHFELARKNVASAIGTVNHFKDRIVDPEVRREIEDRSRELENQLTSLEKREAAKEPPAERA